MNRYGEVKSGSNNVPTEQFGNWTEEQRREIKSLIRANLQRAELLWEKVCPEFAAITLNDAERALTFSMQALTIPSLIPGHEEIDPSVPQVSEFTSLVLDIRDSTKHLTTYLGKQKVQKLERLLYETYGLLPACSRALEYHGGRTTEYLGDGILGIIHAPEDEATTRDESLKEACNAGWRCLDIRHWVNDELRRRYDLPDVDIGIGISWSKAVVTVIGHSKRDVHPKVMGECVFRASKMAGGRNEMHTDNGTRAIWPTVNKGQKPGVCFSSRIVRGVEGFLIGKPL